MGYPSGTFSDPTAGALTVFFSARYETSGGGSLPSWAGGSNSAEIAITCEVLDSSSVVVASAVLSRKGSNPVALTAEYPGSNVNWTVRMVANSSAFNGYVGTFAARDLTIRTRLTKR